MFLTDLDTIIISLFLGSEIILMTLLGIILSFQFKYKEADILISMFFRLVIISIISLLTYGFIILFKWPGLIDFLVIVIINAITIWSYLRLFSVFRQFIKLSVILTGVILTVITFGIFIIQVVFGNNLLMLCGGLLSLLIVINLHFLVLSVLIEFQKEPENEK